jgi:hypothetical protein
LFLFVSIFALFWYLVARIAGLLIARVAIPVQLRPCIHFLLRMYHCPNKKPHPPCRLTSVASCLSPSLTLSYRLLLSLTVSYRLLLSLTVSYRLLLSLTVSYCFFLSHAVSYCLLPSLTISYRLLLSLTLSHFFLLSLTVSRFTVHSSYPNLQAGFLVILQTLMQDTHTHFYQHVF